MIAVTHKAVVIPYKALCALHAMLGDNIDDVCEAFRAHIRFNVASTKRKTMNAIRGFSDGIGVEARGGRSVGG